MTIWLYCIPEFRFAALVLFLQLLDPVGRAHRDRLGLALGKGHVPDAAVFAGAVDVQDDGLLDLDALVREVRIWFMSRGVKPGKPETPAAVPMKGLSM